MQHRSPLPTHIPYTTLFRSVHPELAAAQALRGGPCGAHRLAYPLADRPGGEWIGEAVGAPRPSSKGDRKSTRLNSSHTVISYAVFCLKQEKQHKQQIY